MARHRNIVDWKEDILMVPTCIGDIPIGKRTKSETLNTLTLNEIRKGANKHRFNPRELEYIVQNLCMKISVYLDNRFVVY